MCNIVQLLNVKKTIVVMEATFAVVKRKLEKIKFRLVQGFEPLTSPIPVQRCTGIAEVKGANPIQA